MMPQERLLKDGWIQIGTEGIHPCSTGRMVPLEADFLYDVAANYNRDTSAQAPFVEMHPESQGPVFGSFSRLQQVGGSLYAKPAFVTDGFKERVRDGKLVAVSPSFNMKTRELKHVGALPPGVKPGISGLAPLSDVAFIEGDGEKLVSFSFDLPVDETNGTDETNETLVARIEKRIDDLKQWTANLLKSIKNETPPETPEPETEPAAADGDEKITMEDTMLKNVTPGGDKAATGQPPDEAPPAAEFAAPTPRELEMAKRIETLEKTAKENDVAAFIDGAVGKGQILPSEIEQMTALMGAMYDRDDTVEFTAGGNAVSVTAFDGMAEFIGGLKSRIPLDPLPKGTAGGEGETAEFAGADEEDMELHRRVLEVQKKDGGSYEQAYAKVRSEG